MGGTVEGGRQKAVDRSAERLRRAILSGAFPAGSVLPGERDLSTDMGVSRLTLRAALERLQAEGLVKPIHGSGTRVLDYRESGGVELLGDLAVLAEGGALPVRTLSDLLELRRMVAVEVIGQLATRAGETDVEGLRAHLALQRECIAEPSRYMELDLAFARKLVAATGNTALLLLTNTIVRVLERNPGMEAVFLLHPEGTLAVYARLLDLVEERDPERARIRARRMLASLDHTLMGRLRLLADEAGWEAWR